jgi:hypothetical protein
MMKVTTSSLLLILSALNCFQDAHSWTSSQSRISPSTERLVVEGDTTSGTSTSTTDSTPSCRRGFFTNSITACSTIIAGTTAVSSIHPEEAIAATADKSYPQMKTDKENIVKGYKRLDYLLTNWEKETTICGRTDNPYIGCERTPEKVMTYLGMKSMNDPLFRIDKTLMRLQSVVPADDEVDFMDAMETINQAVEDGNGIAFVSSWGEANPGGGQDRIDLFIERSKRFVIMTKDGLATVMKILDLKVE